MGIDMHVVCIRPYSECEHGHQWLVRSYMSNSPAVCVHFARGSVSGCREKGQMERMCWILICWEYFLLQKCHFDAVVLI